MVFIKFQILTRTVQYQKAREMVFALESAMDQGAASYDDLLGTWELVFSDTQLFRSSPFFMAGRAVCKDGQEAEQVSPR